MPKFFVKQEAVKDNQIKIYGQDVKHIKNVLRKQVNDKLTICNIDKQEDYLCKISEIQKEYIICDIIEKIENNSEPNIEVTILQGLPKFEKMELIIQKSIELGAYEITPVSMERCIVKISSKDIEKKLQRWNKIAEAAAKQSGRNRIPKVTSITNIKNICDNIEKYDILLVAYEKERDNKIKECLKEIKQKYKKSNISDKKLKIAILIGPEGGISEDEIERLKKCGAISVSLGNRILRTETVALNLISIIMYELNDE